MKTNERGGIISKLFLIPAGAVLMAGAFFSGYYLGKHEAKSGASGEAALPLPELVSKNLPKPEEFTFYKTLTEAGNKTVSIDLKPKPANEEARPESKQAVVDKPEKARSLLKEKQTEVKTETAGAEKAPSRQAQARKGPPAMPPVNANKMHYTIQIASYQEKGPADDQVKQMKQRGYAAFVVASALPDKSTWYRVRLGSFTNKAAAEKLRSELRKKEGLSSFVTLE